MKHIKRGMICCGWLVLVFLLYEIGNGFIWETKYDYQVMVANREYHKIAIVVMGIIQNLITFFFLYKIGSKCKKVWYIILSLLVMTFISGFYMRIAFLWNAGNRIIYILVVLQVGLNLVYVINGISLYQMVQIRELETERKMFENAISQQKKSIAQLEAASNQIKTVRHDLKHYLVLLSSLLEKGDVDGAEAIVKELMGSVTKSQYIFLTKNTLINAVLVNKKSFCDEKNISFRVHLNGMVKQEYEMDVAIILSNLLDNAIEAVDKATNKEIVVDMHEIKGEYLICIKNWVEIQNGTKIKIDVLETTKQDKELHGFGLKSVKNYVDKLDGSCEFIIENNFFIASVMIPNY